MCGWDNIILKFVGSGAIRANILLESIISRKNLINLDALRSNDDGHETTVLAF